MLFGVCGGLGAYFGIDPTIIRIVAVLLAIAGFGILAYIILAFIIPLEGKSSNSPSEVIVDNVNEIRDTVEDIGYGMRDTFTGKKNDNEAEKSAPIGSAVTPDQQGSRSNRAQNLLAIVLIIVGGIILMGTLGVWHWVRWGIIWPVVLIVVGILILVNVRRK